MDEPKNRVIECTGLQLQERPATLFAIALRLHSTILYVPHLQSCYRDRRLTWQTKILAIRVFNSSLVVCTLSAAFPWAMPRKSFAQPVRYWVRDCAVFPMARLASEPTGSPGNCYFWRTIPSSRWYQPIPTPLHHARGSSSVPHSPPAKLHLINLAMLTPLHRPTQCSRD